MTIDAEQARTEVTEFGPLTIRFDERVLRPRRWTTAQSAWAAELLRTAPDGPVLELCAGVGHIGLLAVSEHTRSLVLVDASEVACDHARTNVEAAGLTSRVEVRCGRMDEVLEEDERFSMVIADPPWVRTTEVASHPDDPVHAIDGGDDGLDLARTCVTLIGRHLADRGSAVLQLGTVEQVAAISDQLVDDPSLGLQIIEHRSYDERGVLVRIDRRHDD